MNFSFSLGPLKVLVAEVSNKQGETILEVSPFSLLVRSCACSAEIFPLLFM